MDLAFLSPVNAPTSGGTAIKFLSAYGAPSSGTAIKFLDPISAPASGIVPVGSKATAQTLNLSGPASGTAVCALPSGCAAGDTVVLSCNAQAYGGFTWNTPTSGSVVLAPTLFGASSGWCVAIYTYVLTQTDVGAGTIGVPCSVSTSGSWSIPTTVTADVRRAVSDVPVDVVGTLATGTFAPGTTIVTPAAITTTKDDDLIQYALFATSEENATTVTPPAGWTSGDSAISSVNPTVVRTGYFPQTAHGSTGSVALSLYYSGFNNHDYTAVLLSLRKKAPAITLAAPFPSNLHVGDAVSFDVTASEVDGATGSLTITDDQLPAGLALGATSQVDSTHYKATVSGTLTTAQTVTSTFGATGGSVAATALSHQFVVAASSGTVDDFSVAGTVNNYTITEQGSPTGTGAVSGGNLVLTPVRNAVNSVSALRGGTWTAAKARAKLPAIGTGVPRYFCLSIGSGSIVTIGTAGSWQQVALANGYVLRWTDAAHAFGLLRMDAGVSTALALYDTEFADLGAGYHDYDIAIDPVAGTVTALLDGVAVMSANDSKYANGNVLISQGANSDDSGSIAYIETVTLTQ